MTIWSEDVLARLKELCRDPHYSNASIAAVLNSEFHLAISRNAVIGKRTRDKIIGCPRAKNENTHRPRRQSHSRRPRQISPVARLSDEPEPLPIVFLHACSIYELKNETCRFPCGDVKTDTFFFCGDPNADLINGRPYCGPHERLTHYPHSG